MNPINHPPTLPTNPASLDDLWLLALLTLWVLLMFLAPVRRK